MFCLNAGDWTRAFWWTCATAGDCTRDSGHAPTPGVHQGFRWACTDAGDCTTHSDRHAPVMYVYNSSSSSSPGDLTGVSSGHAAGLGISPGILVGMPQEEQCASPAPAGDWILDQDRNFWPPSDKSCNLGPQMHILLSICTLKEKHLHLHIAFSYFGSCHLLFLQFDM